jgi:hypothetical protein
LAWAVPHEARVYVGTWPGFEEQIAHRNIPVRRGYPREELMRGETLSQTTHAVYWCASTLTATLLVAQSPFLKTTKAGSFSKAM